MRKSGEILKAGKLTAMIMMVAVLVSSAVMLCGCGSNDADKVDANGWLSHLEALNEVGNSYDSIKEKYDVVPWGSTDNYHIYESSDELYQFVVIGTAYGVDGHEYGTYGSDICIRMSGAASVMLGIDSAVGIQELADELGCSFEPGQGQGLDLSLSEGLTGALKDRNTGADYTIFIPDVSENSEVQPETLIYINREPFYGDE